MEHTAGRIGCRLDEDTDRVLLSTPPPDECFRRIQEREFPFTSRRIAVCEASHYVPRDENRENARRLAACWNACLDVPTEALETGVVGDLVAACKLALSPGPVSSIDVAAVLNAAITKATGE